MRRHMRVLSLCTGIGGIDLACEATGAMEIVGQVELDDFCTSVLAYHWPHVQRMRDLREVRGDEFGTVEFVVAGFPCQPTSHAGKRRGASDDRWLWPEVHRVIRCARPTWVLCENVPGLITLGLDDVLSDLDSAGYEATACVYPASAVGAPHQRERIFIVGHTREFLVRTRANLTGNLGEATTSADGTGQNAICNTAPCASYSDVADANQHGGRWAQRANDRDVDGACRTDVLHEGHTQRATAECGRADVADTARTRLANRQQAGQHTHDTQGRTGMESEPERRSGAVVYPDGARWEECEPATVSREVGHAGGRSDTRGCDGQIESGVGVAVDGLPGRLAGHPGWPARPGETQHDWEAPRTVPASDKTPNRAAKLKALGNAVVPAQVYPILQAIAETWRLEDEAS